MGKISLLTRFFGIYIIISASFMLEVRSFLIRTFGKQNVQSAFIILFLVFAVTYILYLYRVKLPRYRIGLSISLFLLAYLIIDKLPFFAEKIHVPEYGLLGYLAIRDHFVWDARHSGNPNFRRSGWLKNILWSVFFVALVSWLDESFQWVLPERYFDWRDIFTNIASGLLGIFQYLFSRRA